MAEENKYKDINPEKFLGHWMRACEEANDSCYFPEWEDLCPYCDQAYPEECICGEEHIERLL
jgi:hypothetical protein